MISAVLTLALSACGSEDATNTENPTSNVSETDEVGQDVLDGTSFRDEHIGDYVMANDLYSLSLFLRVYDDGTQTVHAIAYIPEIVSQEYARQRNVFTIQVDAENLDYSLDWKWQTVGEDRTIETEAHYNPSKLYRFAIVRKNRVGASQAAEEVTFINDIQLPLFFLEPEEVEGKRMRVTL